MGRRIDVEDLVGVQEIARRLRVTRQAVHNWKTRNTDGFPAPVAKLDMGLVWSKIDVERWARKTGRLS